MVIKHIDCEGLGLWEGFCRENGLAVEVVALHRGDPLPPPDRFQAVISLGRPMSVDEEGAYPFLKLEDRFIRQTLSEGIPFLGICLGGQLLAKAVGGLVTRNAVKEIGWHPITLDEIGQRDSLFAGLPERFTVFQWHGETFSIPTGAVRLASSQACRNQAFRFGRIAYALQFHLEVTPSMVEEWVHEYKAELAELGDTVNPEKKCWRRPQPGVKSSIPCLGRCLGTSVTLSILDPQERDRPRRIGSDTATRRVQRKIARWNGPGSGIGS